MTTFAEEAEDLSRHMLCVTKCYYCERTATKEQGGKKVCGGCYSYWFEVQMLTSKLFVDLHGDYGEQKNR